MRSGRFWLVGIGLAAAAGLGSLYLVRARQPLPLPSASDGSPARPSIPLPTVNDLRSNSSSNVLSPMTAPQMRTFSAVDLNTASLAELKTIPGITQAYAEKIVAARPYQSFDELARTGIPREVLNGISPPAVIKFSGAGGPLAQPPGGRRSGPQRGPRR